MKSYKIFSFCAMMIFAVVGFLFLFFTDPVLIFFNRLSVLIHMPEAPLAATNFYLALASAYMYLVTVLAFMMYRHPGEKSYAFLLFHGKMASALISLYLFITHRHFLIYLSNFIVDGCIAAAVFYFYGKIRGG